MRQSNVAASRIDFIPCIQPIIIIPRLCIFDLIECIQKCKVYSSRKKFLLFEKSESLFHKIRSCVLNDEKNQYSERNEDHGSKYMRRENELSLKSFDFFDVIFSWKNYRRRLKHCRERMKSSELRFKFLELKTPNLMVRFALF